jgi:hypothetical protein
MATSQHTIVAIQNIDDEDFMFEYNASEGNPPYVIPAGDVARFPQFLAEHALKHLIDKILNKREQKTNNEPLRMELANQIIIGEEVSRQKPQPSEAEKLRMEVEELNKPSTLEAILEKRKEAKAHKKKIVKAEKEQKGVGEKFEGLEDRTEEPVKEDKEKGPAKEAVKPKDVKPMPTRKEIYTFAEKEMNMVLDKNARKKFDKMKVDDLITELQYPLEE